MNLVQFYLLKIAEEAGEVAHIALKAAQFGLSETEPGRLESNAQRLHGELTDLSAMVHRLGSIQSEFFFDIGSPDHMAIVNKLNKVEKYLSYSVELGMVNDPDEDWDGREKNEN